MKKSKKVLYLSRMILFLIIFEIFMSLFLIYSDFNDPGFCSENSCGSVQDSDYGKIFGLKLSYFALISFSGLLIIYLGGYKNLFFISTIIGGLFASYFIFLQIFVLKTICPNCMIVDGSMIVLLMISIVNFRKKGNT